MENPVIAVVAYNRGKALKRLLLSLSKAEYPLNTKLFISLDGGASEEISCIANQFRAQNLNVYVIENKNKLGLRNHIIKCGDFAIKYGSVIVLEDDLMVDRYFYLYAQNAINFYTLCNEIAGIALYAYENNEYAGLPFRPMLNGFSTYAMQVPCSWGQCWTKAQWLEFKQWYTGKNSEDIVHMDDLPCAVKNWPESSWKKYFAAYMVAKNKYFIYPYQAYSTNCSDPGGVHILNGSSVHQVQMATTERPEPIFRFMPIKNKEVLYDAYMEPMGDYIFRVLGKNQSEVTIDLQGIKPYSLLRQLKYVITPRFSDDAIFCFRQHFRPPEVNLNNPEPPSRDGVWFFVPSSSLLESSNYRRSLSEISYYAGLNIASRKIIEQIFLEIPKLVFNKLLKRFI